MIADLLAGIQTNYLPTMSLKFYRYANSLSAHIGMR
jgi:hypothetical protein